VCGSSAKRVWRRFLKLGTLVANTLTATAYGASLAIFDPFLVTGQCVWMETCWLPTLDSQGIEVFIRAMKTAPTPGCAIVTHEFPGAASRVPAAATAFGLRRGHVPVEILASFADRSELRAGIGSGCKPRVGPNG
jgi:hypothetical protein